MLRRVGRRPGGWLMPDSTDISARKSDHLVLCETGDVGFVNKSTLFEDVELMHDALPELHADQVDTTCEVLGKRLRAPLLIAAMTGGTPEAETVNRRLAAAAERHGIGFCFGSQRPLLRGQHAGYRVRDLAPFALVVGNIGVVQAAATSTQQLRELVQFSGADALAIHLNPAQEMAQPGGDRDFRGGLDTIRRVVEEIGVPVLVKETGAGISRPVGERLVAVGVRWIDAGGAGGTSWVAVEMHRAVDAQKALAARFRDWGIPTAAAVLGLRGVGASVIATGGVSDGLDVAKAIALGATAAGMARPLLKAQAAGEDALDAAITLVLAELRAAMVLTGSADLVALSGAKRVLGGRISGWVAS